MSATYRLFERWRLAKGYGSANQGAIALGVDRQRVQKWKDGGNAHPDLIEKMAHDLGEDPVRTILEAYAEQEKGQSARVLEKLSKRFAAVALVLITLGGAPAKPNDYKALQGSFSYIPSSMYIMSRN